MSSATIRKSQAVKPKAYSYIRFSSAKQAQGDSYRRQIEGRDNFILEHGLELDEELTLKDLGLSAYKGDHLGKNGALGQFIRAIDQGLVPSGSYLLVESMDRLSRQKVTSALQMFLAILDKGIVIVTLMDRQIYSSESVDEHSHQLLVSIGAMARAHEESKYKGQRVHDAYNTKKKLAREGKCKVTTRGPSWCKWNKEEQDFELIPEKADVVKRIFDLALRDYGVWDITKMLNDDGVPRLGKATKHQSWEHANVHRMITSRVCIGEYQPTTTHTGKRINDGDPISDYYPRVVDDDTFNKVQLKISARRPGERGSGRKGALFANLFRGISTCGYCGDTFTVAQYRNNYVPKNKKQSDKPKNLAYYKCNGNYRRARCDVPNINYTPIEEHVLDTLVELDFDKIFDRSSQNSEKNEISTELDNKVAELADLQKKITRGSERLFENEDLPDAFYSMLKDLEDKKANLNKEIDVLKAQLSVAIEAQQSNSNLQLQLADAIQIMRNCTNDAELKDMRQNINVQLKFLLKDIRIWSGGQVASDNYYDNLERIAHENGTWKENMFPEEMREENQKSMGTEYDKHKAIITLIFKSGKIRTLTIDLKNNTSSRTVIDPNKKMSAEDFKNRERHSGDKIRKYLAEGSKLLNTKKGA